MTLKEFDNLEEVEDGHYAVWMSVFEQYEGEPAYVFKGEVVLYTNQEGFKDYPDWFEKADSKEINIVFLHALPSIEEILSSGHVL